MNLFTMTTATSQPVKTNNTFAKKVRVCHVSLTLNTGGLERLLSDFSRLHNKEQFHLDFVAMKSVGKFADEIQENHCRVTQLQATGRWKQIYELTRFLKENQIDVVHTHNTYPHINATIAARWAGVPVVVNTRHGQRLGHGWKSRQQYRIASWLADCIVNVSDDAARLCEKTDGIAKKKVTRIWNGIDLEKFTFTGPQQKPTAISVARLSPEKDFATLLQAVAIVVRNIPDFQLTMVGDGQERSSLEQLTAELHLSGHVQFLGDRSDVPQLLAQAGFFVSSSLSEGISLTLLEAMAVGLPIVATAVGGNPEIVEEGNTGMLVPSAHPKKLAEAIITMCQQQSHWQTMGEQGRERVATHFEIRRMIKDYEKLYLEIQQQKAK
ncbi:FIG00929567: hypothetical protein [hydrothermal vent metagenome]|uniref:Glycosyltransferase n=1 Tax=hydrothermal vent metagenome TaxID=652676 RepID=A0A3B1DJE6_9ZZZZ